MKIWKRLKRFARNYMPRNDTRNPSVARRTLIAAADAARDQADWPTAARLYSAALSINPLDRGALIQYGHALKESGRVAEAEGAYQAAVLADQDDPDGWMQLGHIRKLQGRATEALDCYAEALQRNPTYKPARAELLASGARYRLTMANYGQTAATTVLAEIGTTLRRNLEAIDEMLVVSTFPVEAYDAFRKTYAIQPPPEGNHPAPLPLTVLIDARTSSPSAVRQTLTSLLDQRTSSWKAYVLADKNIQNHTVASLAEMDSRISFLRHDEKIDAGDIKNSLEQGSALILTSGAVLDRETVSWFQFVAHRIPDAAAYADHDHFLVHWRTGMTRLAPALQPAPDRHDLATTPVPPAAVLLPGNLAINLLLTPTAPKEAPHCALALAYEAGLRIAHIPRVLTSAPAETGPASEMARESVATAFDPPTSTDKHRILVVIPTRDQVDLLEKCINTLKQKANSPHLLSILIIDNNSEQSETIDYLREAEFKDEIQVLAVPEPFNWSRLNNLGANHTQEGDILVFANNDIEMRTQGWDDSVRRGLRNADVGILGVRLVYPDGTLQHAGIALGGEDNRPHHEGVGASGETSGPSARWTRRRQAAAVTGAFLAVRRHDFVAAGGFNENLAIGYNDIDFCFRIRALGLSVVFEPSVEAVHHESKSRGLNDNSEKIAWDDAELEDLFRIWAGAVFQDPSVNPQWVCTRARSFDGFRDLSSRQVVDWIDYSVQQTPHPVTPARFAAIERAR